MLPDVVALEAEVLDAKARRPGRTMSGLQAPKFWTRPARVRVVEVDPVVRERLVVVDHERDEAERAVPKPLRRLQDLVGGARVEAQHEVAQRDAREHGVDGGSSRPPVVLDDDAR